MDEKLKQEWESCVKCGLCRSVCPVFKELRQEPFVARGHISLLSILPPLVKTIFYYPSLHPKPNSQLIPDFTRSYKKVFKNLAKFSGAL